MHGNAVAKAIAGERTAVNLAGIDTQQLERGQVLTHCGGLASTRVFDAAVEWLPGHEPEPGRMQVMLHAGTMEAPAALKTLSAVRQSKRAPASPGDPSNRPEPALTRIWLSRLLIALPGDRFVLRALSPQQTVAGGIVIDPFPSLRLSRVKTLSRLLTLRTADMPARIQFLVEEGVEGRRSADLVRATGLNEPEVLALVAKNPALVFHSPSRRVIAKAWIEDRSKRLLEWLEAFHRQNPAAGVRRWRSPGHALVRPVASLSE